ncbi:lytic transglycosylase domain-containing protein [Sphaerimonospora mesophila]|uniref:lytic transglycosylase domain-containing protein n=1 Tax=Sphaerimonospora mesophila TaxID=37483 RepID=UPI0006E1FFD8
MTARLLLAAAACLVIAVPLGLVLAFTAMVGSYSCATEGDAGDIPPDYLRLYQQAGQAYGIAWPVLASIGKVESDHGRSTAPGVHSGANRAGAMGPMQFLASTWAAYGVDGDGDGRTDVYRPTQFQRRPVT